MNRNADQEDIHTVMTRAIASLPFGSTLVDATPDETKRNDIPGLIARLEAAEARIKALEERILRVTRQADSAWAAAAAGPREGNYR